MGEQPKPVDDDVERALVSMRAGFLAGSEQIAAHIGSLDEHLVDAPSEEREAVHAQVARLVAAHDRITAKVMSAPASSWDGFKVMVSAVKQQQAVLDQVSHLVKEHVLPRQIESLPITPFPASPPPAEPPPAAALPLPPHDDGFDPGNARFRASAIFQTGGNFHADVAPAPDPVFSPGDGLQQDALAVPRSRPPQPKRRPRPLPASRTRSENGFRALAAAGLRERDGADAEDIERPSLLALLRERTAGFRGLAAMLLVGIILSLLPREKLHEVGNRLFDLVAPAGPEVAPDDRPPDAPKPPALPRSVERVPSTADADDGPAPAPKAAASAPAPEENVPAAADKAPVAASKAKAPEEAPVAAPKKHAERSADETPVAAPKKHVTDEAEKAPKAAPEVTAAKAAGQAAPPPAIEARFVPVVFTHKDHATVMRALADLKQQFPTVLVGLEGEVQPLDLGKKGIWHRLVFLPAGPRQHATRVCDQLAAKGYDRCWVKEY